MRSTHLPVPRRSSYRIDLASSKNGVCSVAHPTHAIGEKDLLILGGVLCADLKDLRCVHSCRVSTASQIYGAPSTLR